MTESNKTGRIKTALENHAKGYNCAQAVSCAFCDQVDIDESTLFRMTEGLGLGMGGMDGTCGAISSAAILAGLKCSTGHLENPDSKASSYKAAKECMSAFKDKHGTVVCRDLKGVDSKQIIRSCDGCIKDATAIIELLLFNQ